MSDSCAFFRASVTKHSLALGQSCPKQLSTVEVTFDHNDELSSRILLSLRSPVLVTIDHSANLFKVL